jgi:hypothetical protein
MFKKMILAIIALPIMVCCHKRQVSKIIDPDVFEVNQQKFRYHNNITDSTEVILQVFKNKAWQDNLSLFALSPDAISFENDFNDDGYKDVSSMLLRGSVVHLFNPKTKGFEKKSIGIGNCDFSLIDKEKNVFFDDYCRDLNESNLFSIKNLKQTYLYQIQYQYSEYQDSVYLSYIKVLGNEKIKTQTIAVDDFELKQLWTAFLTEHPN